MTWPRGQVLQPWGQVEPSDLALVSSDLQLGPSDLQIGPGDLEIGPSGGFPGLCRFWLVLLVTLPTLQKQRNLWRPPLFLTNVNSAGWPFVYLR